MRKNKPKLKLTSLRNKLKTLSWGEFVKDISPVWIHDNGIDLNHSEDGKPLSKKALKKLEKEREKAARKAETAARVAQEQGASDTPVRCYFKQSMK